MSFSNEGSGMRRVASGLVIAAATAALAACGQPATQESGAATTASAPAAAPAPALSPEKAALLASLPAPYNTGDLANGQKQFQLCRSCHTITEGGANMTGPNLYGLFGRTAGTVEKFRYSEPVKAAGFAWDAEKLNQWLADPRGFLPGNRMSFMGVKDAKDRTDLIAYLKVETGYKPGG
jgi:cytochrome c